jgi:hypothetical protein
MGQIQPNSVRGAVTDAPFYLQVELGVGQQPLFRKQLAFSWRSITLTCTFHRDEAMNTTANESVQQILVPSLAVFMQVIFEESRNDVVTRLPPAACLFALY